MYLWLEQAILFELLTILNLLDFGSTATTFPSRSKLLNVTYPSPCETRPPISLYRTCKSNEMAINCT